MVLDLDPRSVEIGRRLHSYLVKALGEALNDETLPRLLPFIAAGVASCDGEAIARVKETMMELFAWLNFRWYLSPRGPPPFIYEDIVALIACGKAVPLIDEVMRDELGPPTLGGEEPMAGGEDLGGTGENLGGEPF